MAARGPSDPAGRDSAPTAQRIQELSSSDPVAGVTGPGRWLIAEFAPVSLFSLKTSQATSSVGRTLLVPTPYAIKMACVDAGFRAGWPEQECADLLESLAGLEVRVRPPTAAVVTHTIVKVRQEPKRPTPLQPYTSNIAYREVVHHAGQWAWAFDLAAAGERAAIRLVEAVPHIRYVGKRGSFVQFLSLRREQDVGLDFSAPVRPGEDFQVPPAWHLQQLDDYGPQATFARLSSYSGERAVRGRDRIFTTTVIPLGLHRSGPGFSEYRARGGGD